MNPYPLFPVPKPNPCCGTIRIWVWRLGAWVVYDSSFVSDQDIARHLRHYARVAAKVAREAAKDNSK